MFSMLSNLTKAAVSVVAAPVAAVVDVVTLPESSCDLNKGPFDRTSACLKNAGDAFMAAVKPEGK